MFDRHGIIVETVCVHARFTPRGNESNRQTMFSFKQYLSVGGIQ